MQTIVCVIFYILLYKYKKADLFYRMKRLVDYKEMGNTFKVLFAQKKKKKFTLGF